MSLDIGSRLGHYDVTALIEGGMGQVYQATDITLNRQGGSSVTSSEALET